MNALCALEHSILVATWNMLTTASSTADPAPTTSPAYPRPRTKARAIGPCSKPSATESSSNPSPTPHNNKEQRPRTPPPHASRCTNCCAHPPGHPNFRERKSAGMDSARVLGRRPEPCTARTPPNLFNTPTCQIRSDMFMPGGQGMQLSVTDFESSGFTPASGIGQNRRKP